MKTFSSLKQQDGDDGLYDDLTHRSKRFCGVSGKEKSARLFAFHYDSITYILLCFFLLSYVLFFFIQLSLFANKTIKTVKTFVSLFFSFYFATEFANAMSARELRCFVKCVTNSLRLFVGVCVFFFIEYRLPISRLRVELHDEFMYKSGDPQACKKVN